MYINMQSHTYKCIRLNRHIHTLSQTHTVTDRHTYTHSQTYSHSHTHSHTHRQRDTHTSYIQRHRYFLGKVLIIGSLKAGGLRRDGPRRMISGSVSKGGGGQNKPHGLRLVTYQLCLYN